MNEYSFYPILTILITWKFSSVIYVVDVCYITIMNLEYKNKREEIIFCREQALIFKRFSFTNNLENYHPHPKTSLEYNPKI